MFLFVFAGVKRSDELQSFNVLYLPIKSLLQSATEKSQKVLVTVAFFLFFIVVLSLFFE